MAATPVLADSSFYIDCLRKGQDPLRILAITAGTRDLAICPVIRCEVARGIRVPKIRQRLTQAWDVMINVPTDARLWQNAEQKLWELDRQGVVLPLTDVVIACCAIRVGALVLTFDRHFHEIPGVRSSDHLDD